MNFLMAHNILWHFHFGRNVKDISVTKNIVLSDRKDRFNFFNIWRIFVLYFHFQLSFPNFKNFGLYFSKNSFTCSSVKLDFSSSFSTPSNSISTLLICPHSPAHNPKSNISPLAYSFLIHFSLISLARLFSTHISSTLALTFIFAILDLL